MFPVYYVKDVTGLYLCDSPLEGESETRAKPAVDPEGGKRGVPEAEVSVAKSAPFWKRRGFREGITKSPPTRLR